MSKMLSSWKEIAHFFGKGVRTVQRWEKTLDLPIHRPPGAPSNVVLARTSDLEDWMHRGPIAKAVVSDATGQDGEAYEGAVDMLQSQIVSLAAQMGVKAEPHKVFGSPVERVETLNAVLRQIRERVATDSTARAA